jgi:NodT family efflux transporter outer membrane factor (OMF) lipoprotein
MPSRFALALAAAALLCGCTVGPRYVRPQAPETAAFKEGGQWKLAQPREDLPRGNWWEMFGDEQLNKLIARVSVSNQTLRVAEAQYREAVAIADEARAQLFPTVTATASVSRARSSALSASGSASPAATSYSASATASWDADLWGRIRSTLEANEASAQASAGDLASAQLSAQAELAQDYFLLRVADEQKRLFDQTAAAYQTSLDLTVNRYKAGVAAKSDIVQAQTQLVSTQAQAIEIGVQRAQLEHAIAILIGAAPAQFSIEPEPFAVSIPEIPVSVPSVLLERRPDIAANERRVAAANAQIGVAQAAYFPDFTLSATGGYRSFSFPRWFDLPSRFWSLGPSLAETLLDFGLRDAQKAQAVAAYDAAVATYRQTVLTGFQQVEDNLAALRILEEEARVQDEAVRLAREAVQLTINQYKAGTVNYLNVITTQATEFTNETAAVVLLGRRLTASVLLVQDMGGGWSVEQIPPTRADMEHQAEQQKAALGASKP